MYVCICNAIRESELRDVGRRSAGNAEQAYAALGKRPNCGQCLARAENVLAEERRLPGCALTAAMGAVAGRSQLAAG